MVKRCWQKERKARSSSRKRSRYGAISSCLLLDWAPSVGERGQNLTALKLIGIRWRGAATTSLDRIVVIYGTDAGRQLAVGWWLGRHVVPDLP